MDSGKDESEAARKVAERQKRLRAALRANLKRRKEQARQRESQSGGRDGKPPRGD